MIHVRAKGQSSPPVSAGLTRPLVLLTAAIERELQKAIEKAGLVDERNFGDLSKLGWARSSRTDKGVHSVGTLIAVNLEVQSLREKLQAGFRYLEEDKAGMITTDKINAHLPADIRILGAIPVSKSWRRQRSIGSRIYEYLLPQHNLRILTKSDSDLEGKLRTTLEKYQGTHCWHNFTAPSSVARAYKGRGVARPWVPTQEAPTPTPNQEIDEEEDSELSEETKDGESGEERTGSYAPWVRGNVRRASSLFRTVHTITVDSIEVSDTPYYRLTLHGSSFLRHQIRKMIGGALMVMSGGISDEILSLSRSSAAAIPMVMSPSTGLLVERPVWADFDWALRIPHSIDDNRYTHKQLYPHIHAEWGNFDWKGWRDQLERACNRIPSVDVYQRLLEETRLQSTSPGSK